jgi:hypothetical protein
MCLHILQTQDCFLPKWRKYIPLGREQGRFWPGNFLGSPVAEVNCLHRIAHVNGSLWSSASKQNKRIYNKLNLQNWRFYSVFSVVFMARNGVQHGCQACAFWLKIKIQNGVFLYNLIGNNVKLVFLITYGWEIQNVHI